MRCTRCCAVKAATGAPLIVVDRMARTPAGMKRLVELAEVLQCPVVDQAGRQSQWQSQS